MSFKEKIIFETVKKCKEINEELKKRTLCFTGHRCQKLPWGFNEEDMRCIKMKKVAKQKIEQAIFEGYIYFISGMALGFDMICAEIVLELKKKYPHIQLVCAIPCKNQDLFWSKKYKIRYREILGKADIVRYITKKYTKSCMLERNDYMLKNSSKVIALFNGIKGGTKSTILKAKKMGLVVDMIEP